MSLLVHRVGGMAFQTIAFSWGKGGGGAHALLRQVPTPECRALSLGSLSYMPIITCLSLKKGDRFVFVGTS